MPRVLVKALCWFVSRFDVTTRVYTRMHLDEYAYYKYIHNKLAEQTMLPLQFWADSAGLPLCTRNVNCWDNATGGIPISGHDVINYILCHSEQDYVGSTTVDSPRSSFMTATMAAENFNLIFILVFSSWITIYSRRPQAPDEARMVIDCSI